MEKMSQPNAIEASSNNFALIFIIYLLYNTNIQRYIQNEKLNDEMEHYFTLRNF